MREVKLFIHKKGEAGVQDPLQNLSEIGGGILARPTKQTVDYFPHFVDDGKTKFILQNLYGNDGYSFRSEERRVG